MPEVDFTRDDLTNTPVKAKIKAGKEVIRNALIEMDTSKTVIGFTGGKDSTLTAWLVKQVCEEEELEKPDFMFIDHGQHFEEIEQYVENISEKWGFNLHIVKNTDFLDKVSEPGDTVEVSDLNQRNIDEVRRLQSDAETVSFELDTELGNHLLKTVAMNRFIEEQDIDAVINGIRWDEHESRSSEEFYSVRDEPSHIRVHPILQFTEKNVWQGTWFHMVPDTVEEINGLAKMPDSVGDLPVSDKSVLPVSPKYWNGFRSLGSEEGTDKSGDVPAWKQDLEGTSERGGRAQNKDEKQIMENLRKAGYM